MASFSYLWNNRVKFSPFLKLFYIVWGKRLFSLPDLFKKSFRFASLKRKGANISRMAEIGEITINGKRNLLSVGDLSFLGKVEIALHDKVTIGKNVCINDDVVILTASHDVFDPKWPHKKAEIIIEDYVWVGTGAMILPGVHLGRGCVVGARAVVSKSVNPMEIVVGNPARTLNKKRDIEFNYNPCEFLTTNRAWLIG